MANILIEKGDFFKYLYLEDKKIALKKISEGKEAEEVIVSDCESDFDACFDDEGKLNLIYQNSEGELVLLILSERGWHKKVLYSYPDKNTHLDNFTLLIKNKVVHLFYTLSSISKPREMLLIHQKWDKNWSGKNIALIKGPLLFPFYEVFLEDERNVHLLYTTFEKNKTQLYYLFYTQDSWSPKFLISESEKIFSPAISVDSQKNIHTLWIEEDIIQEIKYKKKTPGSWPKGNWTAATTLAYSTEIKNLHLSVIDNNLWGSYIQKDSLFATISSDSGNSWSKPFKLPFSLQEVEFFKLRAPLGNLQSNYIFLSKKGEIIPLEYKPRKEPEEKSTYFTFYIKEVQEYLNLLIKKLQTLKEEKSFLEEELNRKNAEIAMKNKNIFELQELLKQANEEKAKISLKADNYNTMVNRLMRENENLKRQIKDLQNQVLILNSKLESIKNATTFQKIKSLFIKEED